MSEELTCLTLHLKPGHRIRNGFTVFFIELDIKDEKSSRTTVPRGRQNVHTVKRLNSPLITDRKHLRGPHKDS